MGNRAEKLTEVLAVTIPLVIGLVYEDIGGVIHAVELHELMHQLQGYKAFGGLVDLLAKRILPEEGWVLAVLAFLLLYDLFGVRAVF